MLHGSGPEPIHRIYAEAPSPAAAQKLIRAGVGITKEVA
jgi:phosphomannomutase